LRCGGRGCGVEEGKTTSRLAREKVAAALASTNQATISTRSLPYRLVQTKIMNCFFPELEVRSVCQSRPRESPKFAPLRIQANSTSTLRS
jgi:hypothetical protein